MVPQVRIELTTYPLPRDCATTTLLRQSWYFRSLRPNPLAGQTRKKAGCYNLSPRRRKAARAPKPRSEPPPIPMPKRPPEKLAAALRANLKKRKAARSVLNQAAPENLKEKAATPPVRPVPRPKPG